MTGFSAECFIRFRWRVIMKKLRPIIVHSAGIKRNGRGYIFFGGPGSGKSTIASFSKKFTVLHDDMNLVSLDEKTVMLKESHLIQSL